MKDREPVHKETFRSDLNPTTPEGTTNYQGWHLKLDMERQAKVPPSAGSGLGYRLISHAFILSMVAATVLTRACER